MNGTKNIGRVQNKIEAYGMSYIHSSCSSALGKELAILLMKGSSTEYFDDESLASATNTKGL